MIVGVEYWFNYYEIVQNGVDDLYYQEFQCYVNCFCQMVVNENCWDKQKCFKDVEFKVDIYVCFCYQQ